MNPKNTCLLVLVTAGLFAFIWFFERHQHKPPPGPTLVFPNFQTNQVAGIQVHLPDQLEIRAERTNDAWQLTQPLPYPARTEAVANLLQAVVALSPQAQIPAQVLKEHKSADQDFGFLNPQATLVFQQGDEERTLMLGNLTPPGDQIYAQVVGVDHVDILDADFFKKFVPHTFNDWRDPTFINFAVQPFDHLAVSYGSQVNFELSRTKTNQFWRMNKPVLTRADHSKIENQLLDLQELHVTRFITDDPHADLESYGLQPPALELQFASGSNIVLDLQFGKSPTNDAGQIYARCNGQSTIVLVPREPIAPWLAGYQAFRDRHLVRLGREMPEVIEVSGSGAEKFTVEHQADDTWRVTQPVSFIADTNLMRAFISNLVNLEVVVSNNEIAVKDAVLPDSDFPIYGLVEPSRRYLLKRNAPAGASNTVIAELDFGSVKDGKVFARRGDLADETSVYAVKRGDFEKLPASSLDLRDRHIWNFESDPINSLTIRQNGKETRILHVGTNQWNIAVGSQGLTGDDLVIEVGAEELGQLEAQDWISSGDRDRAKFGFSAGGDEIRVEMAGGANNSNHEHTASRTVELGGWSPQGLRYGEVRMPDGQDWIFEFSAVQYGRLAAYFKLPEGPTH